MLKKVMVVVLVIALVVMTACAVPEKSSNSDHEPAEKKVESVAILLTETGYIWWDVYSYDTTGYSTGYEMDTTTGKVRIMGSVIIEKVGPLQAVEDIHKRYDLK